MKFFKKLFTKWGWIKEKKDDRCPHGVHGTDCYYCYAKELGLSNEPDIIKTGINSVKIGSDLPKSSVNVVVSAPKTTPHIEPRKQATITRHATPPVHYTTPAPVIHNTTIINDDSSFLDDVVTGIAVASLLDSSPIYVDVDDSYSSNPSDSSDWFGGGGNFDGGGSSDEW